MSSLIVWDVQLSKSFKSMKTSPIQELPNASGGFLVVANTLLNKYLKVSALSAEHTALYKLLSRPDMSLDEKAVLTFCFEGAILPYAYFNNMVSHIEAFLAKYPEVSDSSHWPQISSIIKNSHAAAIGVDWHTGGDLWFKSKGSRISTSSKSFFLVDSFLAEISLT